MAQKYFKANIKKIESLRIPRGWSREKLASKAILSIRTLDSLMAGEDCALGTFVKLAKALDTTVDSLLDGYEPPATQPRGLETPANPSATLSTQPIKGIKIWFGDDSPYTLDTPPDVLAYLLGQSIAAQQKIVVIEITKGSIIVEVEMSEEDVLRLVAAFAETRLDAIHVEAVRVPATTGPLAAGLLQIIHGEEVVADERLDPATEAMTLLRNPNAALGFSVQEPPAAQATTNAYDRIIRWSRRHYLLVAALLLMIAAAILATCFALRRKPLAVADKIDHSAASTVGMLVCAMFPQHSAQGRRDWERLITARTNHPSVPLRVVMAPQDVDNSVMDKAIQAGIEFYAVIPCDDGQRRPGALIQEVELLHKRYGGKLAGFFFFRSPLDKKYVADYANVFKTVRSLNRHYSIITSCWFHACDEGFLSIAGSDVICIQTDRFLPDPPLWFSKYEPSRFGAIMAGVPNLPKAEDYIKHVTENHMNWVYAEPGYGWSQLPQFFEDEVKYIESLNAEVRRRGMAPKK
jgi:transcriptional regulator with XRE-family HTH domain